MSAAMNEQQKKKILIKRSKIQKELKGLRRFDLLFALFTKEKRRVCAHTCQFKPSSDKLSNLSRTFKTLKDDDGSFV